MEIKKPSLSTVSLEYTGTTRTPGIKNASTSVLMTGDLSATELGKYTIVFSLKNPDKDTWAEEDDGGTEPYSLNWWIVVPTGGIKLSIPSLSPTSYGYDGDVHSPTINGYDSSKMTKSGTESAVSIGSYDIVFSLKDTSIYKWSDSSITPQTRTWKITSKKISKPSLTSASFTYNGRSQSPTLNSNFDSSLMTSSGDLSSVNVGNYSMTISLKDKVNCCWSDGSTADIELSWKITRANITATPSQSVALKYSGCEQSPYWENYDSYQLSISPSNVSGHTGALSAVNVGTYYVQFTPTDNYQWSNGSTAAREVAWKIGRADLPVPTLNQTEFEYTGQEIDIKPFLNNYDSTKMSISGETGTNVKSYTVTFALTDNNYQWVALTGTVSTSNKSVSWRITKKPIVVPTVEDLEFTYDGNDHFPRIDNLDSGFINITGTGSESKTEAGTYQITFTLKSTANLQWADNTTAAKTYTWEIKRKYITKPKILERTLSFDYNGETHAPVLVGFDDSSMTKSGTLSANDAGNYTIKVTPTKNYMWEDETTETITLSWAIERMPIPYPYFAPGDEVIFYTGNFMSPPTSKLLNYSAGKIGLVGTNNKYVGDYSISCTPTRNYKWEDGSTGQYVVAWKVRYRANIPICTPDEFVYDGQEHSPELTYSSENVNCDGTISAVEVGEYKAVFSLKNPNNYAWADKTFSDKVFTWSISAPQYEVIEKFPVQKGVLYYNGNLQSPEWENYDSEKLIIGGAVRGINADTYTVTFTPVNGYAWVGGSMDTVSVTWVINKMRIEIPELINDKLEYTGERRSPQIDGYIDGIMSIDGDKGAVDVGEYTAYVGLLDTDNYSWSDGTTERKPLNWEITHKKLGVLPFQKGILIYNGESQIPVWDNWDRDEMTLGGVTSGINAGEYEAEFTPTYNYCWADGSRNAVKVPWAIIQMQLGIPKQDGEIIYNKRIQSPFWNEDFDPVHMTVSGETSGTDAGTYVVMFECDPNCVFENGENFIGGDWEILPSPTAVPPVIEDKVFEYNGTSRMPTWEMNGEEAERVFVCGDLSAINAGNYTITAYPNPNYRWEDGSDTGIDYQWAITRKPLLHDPGYNGTLVLEYSGEVRAPEWIFYPQNFVSVDGALSAVDSGDYLVTFSVDGNHCWTDGTFSSFSIEWKINRKKIPYPQNRDTLVYNGSEQSPNWLYYNNEEIEISRDISGVDAGEYTSRFTPRSNYQWENGETYAVNIDWIIDKYHFKYPVQAENSMPQNPYDYYGRKYLRYNGSEQTPTLWFGNIYDQRIVTFDVSLYFEMSGDVSAVNVGEYSMVLVPDKNHCWEHGDSEPYAVPWKIAKRSLPLPKKNGDEYYTGEVITPVFENYDPSVLEISGETSGVERGIYVAYFEIIDKDNNTWENNTRDLTEYDKAAVSWKIVRPLSVAEIPYQKNRLQYNGEWLSPAFANYDTSLMILIGGIPSKIDIGVYYVTFRLKEHVIWADGTTEDKVVPWKIEKRRHPKPYVLMPEDGGGMYYYEIDGNRYPIWVYYDPDIMTIGGDTCDTDGSPHTTTFELKDPDNNAWEDGNSDIYEAVWNPEIPYVPKADTGTGEVRVHIPQQIDPEYEDGTVKYPKWDRFDPVISIVGGIWDGIDRGTYHVILSIRDRYIWEDGTVGIKTVPWYILGENMLMPENPEPISVHIPVQINIPEYDGQVKHPEWDLWDEFGFDIIGGKIYGVLPDTYLIELSPKPGNIWEDGTAEDIIIEWIIIPRKPIEIPDDPVPKEPLPEVEGYPDGDTPGGYPSGGDPSVGNPPNGGGGGICCCCCDTGLFDKLNNCDFDDGADCDCSGNVEV